MVIGLIEDVLGNDIQKELSEEQYSHYLSLRNLLHEYERALDKEPYADIVNKLCDLLPNHKEKITQITTKAFQELADDENYLTPDEISSLLD